MKFLICGLGSIGKRHLSVLRELGDFEYAALRSGNSSISSNEDIEEIFNVSQISRGSFDGALITNPTSKHIDTALQIAEYEIPLFIEKPLDRNLKRADELKKVADEKNIPVLIGYNMLYHPAIESLRELVRGNSLGKIVSARAQFGTYMPAWHKDEDYRKSYAANASLGGGVVLTSIHEQNYLTEMFGEITEVKAMETRGNVLGIDSEEGAEIIFRHHSGVISNVHLNFFQRPYTRTCQLIGTDGTAFWDFMIPEIKVMAKGKSYVINLGNDYNELLSVSYKRQMQHFLSVIKREAKANAPLDSGIRDMKTALTILQQIGRI